MKKEEHMSKQPEALRLADAIDPRNEDELFWRDREAAAAKLRRLHAELRRLQIDGDARDVHLSERMKDLFKVEAQRDALLEALKMLVLATKEVSVGRYNEEVHDIALSKARAAIKAAGQESA